MPHYNWITAILVNKANVKALDGSDDDDVSNSSSNDNGSSNSDDTESECY